MLVTRTLTTLALLASALVRATDIRGYIQLNDICKSVNEVQEATVLLDGGWRSSLIRRTGEWVLHDVQPGTYVLSVNAQHFVFDQFRIDVSGEGSTHSVHPYVPGTPLLAKANLTLGYPIALVARRRNAYFVPRDSFNLIAMFNNPMMLLMGFTAIMMFAMPVIMRNLDPATAADVRQTQAKISGFQTSVQRMDIEGVAKMLTSGSQDEGGGGAQSKKASPSPSAAGASKKSHKSKKR